MTRFFLKQRLDSFHILRTIWIFVVSVLVVQFAYGNAYCKEMKLWSPWEGSSPAWLSFKWNLRVDKMNRNEKDMNSDVFQGMCAQFIVFACLIWSIWLFLQEIRYLFCEVRTCSASAYGPWSNFFPGKPKPNFSGSVRASGRRRGLSLRAKAA